MTTTTNPPPRLGAGHLDRKRFERAPCYLCGYNGEGYYQPDKHPCAARYHAQQPTDVDDEENLDAWRALWLVLRQTGTVVVPLSDIVSADWSKCQIEQTKQQLTGAVQLRATLLPAKHKEPTT